MLGATASRGRGRLISRPGTCTSCKERTFLTEANEGVPDSGNTTSRKHPPSLSSFPSVKLIPRRGTPHGLFLQNLTKATTVFPLWQHNHMKRLSIPHLRHLPSIDRPTTHS